MKKRICSLALAAVMLFAGCAKNNNESAGKGANQEKTQSAEEGKSTQALQTNIVVFEKNGVKTASCDVYAMDTYMQISCYGERCEEAVQAAADEIHRIDELLSVGNAEGEIGKINAKGSGVVDEDTAKILNLAWKLYDTSEGKFDITIYTLMEQWGFTTQEYCVPDQSEIEEQIRIIGMNKLQYDAETKELILGDGQGIDLGGIAKGFTSDRIMEIFASYDLIAGTVSLGGNVQTYSTKPDGSLWKCGIQDPMAADSSQTAIFGTVAIADKAVITSGPYERYFEANGKKYHHIIDPATGYPAESGLLSVSIVSESGILADGLSTSCYIMGLEEAAQYWRESEDAFDFIIMTDDQQVYITEGLEACFTTDYPMHVITR